ncbi:MAG: trypsin-like peptidase domain-containing protein [Candidatus Sumerlaeia bacterium]|nr:trypsin-like peptidase domain-containing protein [Candidatus Sumerlaeia bacterium]
MTALLKRFASPFFLLLLGVALGCALANSLTNNLGSKGYASTGSPQGSTKGATATATPVVTESLPDVIERVSPSVVTVGAVKERIDAYYRDFFNPFMIRPRYSLERTPFLGSGLLIDNKGHILTNFHVIENSQSVFVTLQSDSGGREIPATVLDVDPFVDLALLKIEVPAEELPAPMELGDSSTLRIGETAIAFGNPFGNFIADPRPTVTVGVVSALNRSFQPDQRNQRVYNNMIQTDAAINPGNSGGPLVDAAGRAIGVNTFIVSQTGGNIGLGFAIPINRAKAFIEEVLTHGRVRPLKIDFQVETFNRPQVQGILVVAMLENGPAREAGLELGDLILTVNGRRVATREEFLLIVASMQVGDTLKLVVQRNREQVELKYTLAEDTSRQ